MNRDQILVVSLLYLHQSLGFENVALRKTAYQIDTRFHANASLAIDGNTTQYFWNGSSCSLTYTNSSPFWYVDLEAIYAIDHVVIYKRMDPCCFDRLRDVELHIGKSNSSFVQVAYHKGILDPVFTFQLQSPVKGRWVKIRKVGETGYLSLCEVMVMSSSVVYSNYVKVESTKGSGDIITSIAVRSAIQCGVECSKQDNCVSFNIWNVSESVYLTCDLLSSNVSVAKRETGLDYFVMLDL